MHGTAEKAGARRPMSCGSTRSVSTTAVTTAGLGSRRWSSSASMDESIKAASGLCALTRQRWACDQRPAPFLEGLLRTAALPWRCQELLDQDHAKYGQLLGADLGRDAAVLDLVGVDDRDHRVANVLLHLLEK